MLRYIIFCTLLSIVFGATFESPCGQTPITPELDRRSFIVGGTEARNNSWPWQVTIGEKGYHNCGGSIIAKRWILTAAHCFDDAEDEFEVGVGYHHLNSLSGKEETFELEKIILHENYDKKQINNDVALMKLKEDIVFSDFAQPICLPDQGEEWNGEDMVTTGWGALKEKGPGSDVLRQVVVKHIPFETCSKPDWNGDEVFKNTMLCAGDPNGGKDSCQGDSGGPLVIKQEKGWVQAGITSWGNGCGDEKKPGVYTKLSTFVNWINDKIAKN